MRVHRVGAMEADEVTVIEGIPGTSPARTILDVSAELSPRELERLIARAERQKLTTCDELRLLLERYPRRSGTRLLHVVLGREGGPALTRSEPEGVLLDIIRSARLPLPRTNVRIAGFEVDFAWPARRLIVEVDGFTFYSSREMLERDRSRDRLLKLAGYDVLRFTVRDLVESRDVVLAQLVKALEAPQRG